MMMHHYELWWDGGAFGDLARSWDYGDVPTWIASLATSGALIATAWTLALNERDRRRRDHQAERDQARLIRISEMSGGGGGSNRGSGVYARKFEFTIINQSLDAIHDIHVEARCAPGETILGPREWDHDFLAPTGIKTMAFVIQVPYPKQAPFPKAPTMHPSFTAWFTDINGLRWERAGDYRLNRLKH